MQSNSIDKFKGIKILIYNKDLYEVELIMDEPIETPYPKDTP